MSAAVEIFFEKFGEFTDETVAVGELRDLILELALRGALTDRVPNDLTDPTWEHLTTSEIPDPSVADSPPFNTPSEWVWGRVGNVASNCGQKTPDQRFTYVDVGTIDNLTGCINAEAAVLDPEQAPSRARKLVKPGTVIYSTVRPYLKNIAIIECDFEPEAIVSTAFAVMLPEPFLDTRFLFYWLRSSSFEQEVGERMKGVAYPAINDKEFRKCPIPLPPLAEQ